MQVNNLHLIQELIIKYYELERGAHIPNYQEKIFFYKGDIEIWISRRALKHIVESRKQNNYSPEKIFRLFSSLHEILQTYSYVIIDNTETKDFNSKLLVETNYDEDENLVTVLEIVFVDSKHYIIKTCFYRSTIKVQKMLKQKQPD